MTDARKVTGRLWNQFRSRALIILIAALYCPGALPSGQTRYVSNLPSRGSFKLAARGSVATLHLDSGDDPGVIRAARDLQADIERVTGLKPHLETDPEVAQGEVVLIGTISKSRIIASFWRSWW